MNEVNLMQLQQLKQKWKQAEAQAFSGWDFSYIAGQMISEPLPWDYKDIVTQYLKSDYELLDMGTGGGEFLLTLDHPYDLTSVTEAYPPNIEICKNKLVPLGITVQAITDDHHLGFADESFDMIINRHEAFDPRELNRLLRPNGYFITQQVGGLNNKDLSHKVGIKRAEGDSEHNYSEHHLDNNLDLLRKAGFKVLVSNECYPKVTFASVEAFVYFAKIIEWEFPRFSVETCFEQLCELQNEFEENGFIVGTEHRFMIVAQKAI
jgi:SAM-dependent methyltransferase